MEKLLMFFVTSIIVILFAILRIFVLGLGLYWLSHDTNLISKNMAFWDALKIGVDFVFILIGLVGFPATKI